MERYIATQFYKADSPESRILGESGLVPSEFVLAADAQRALDAERARVKELQGAASTPINELLAELISCAGVFDVSTDYEDDRKALETATQAVLDHVATLQAQLARWKEALGEWLWNCTNLLGDYHIKTVQDFNEEVNRRIAWLMQHLDHTLPPPMTDEERDRMRKLSEDNAALQADNECKDSLIETLQAQLRQVEGERNTARHRVDELEAREIDVEILQGDLTTLRQLVEALINSDTAKDHDKAWFALRATLAAKDAPHPTEERS